MFKTALILPFASALAGCASLADVSSGQVGCSPHDITVSDVQTLADGKTWTAECAGRTFYCSAHSGTETKSPGQVSCSESRSESTASPPNARAQDAPPIATKAAPLTTDPPTGAGGFTFGALEGDVHSACEKGGFAYATVDATHASCAGVAASIGDPAHASFTYCSGKLCGVSLRIELAANESVTRALVRWKSALIDRYGGPSASNSKVPGGCESTLTDCLQDHSASIRLDWRWPTRHKILLTPVVDDSKKASVVIEYTAPEWSAAPGL